MIQLPQIRLNFLMMAMAMFILLVAFNLVDSNPVEDPTTPAGLQEAVNNAKEAVQKAVDSAQETAQDAINATADQMNKVGDELNKFGEGLKPNSASAQQMTTVILSITTAASLARIFF